MASLLRRLRGAIGMGLTWALAWFLAGMALLLVVGPDAADVPFPLGFGMFGFFAGTLFSGVLAAVEGRRRFDEMSIPRFAAWGAAGGLLLAVAFVSVVALLGESLDLLVLAPVFAVAGAGSAAGTLAVARWAESGDALGPGGSVDEVGLTEAEKKQLLGGGG
jgi:peptidoglycan/LPS O-acetylase OafA/YrhL